MVCKNRGKDTHFFYYDKEHHAFFAILFIFLIIF